MTLCRFMLLLSAALLLSGCDRSVGWLDHQGVALDREQLQGQRVLVNFWAEWCAPCRDELPELNRLAAELPRGGVVGIDYDGATGEQLQAVVTRMGIRFPVLGAEFASAYGLPRPQVLPTTYLLDGEGAILATLQGPQHYDDLKPLMATEAGE
ncbi:TlpA family protein disulfide reductase [Halopseudomonas aestusnigri]|uniref:TlpA family protein disulfide reductase n=1 Tax=Halopseudomonas aestusnigri TaxID=857252 RepID=UPI001E3947C6|nr:TlpA disulfide reductase family protein [Halopseudomonas aestusnigri]UGV31659.1 TlpA family protein disulfide reductase [Halopseudomonas aestusnigri]